MHDESLHAQTAIQIWRQERVNPARILGAVFVAIVSAPQGNYSEEARLLIGDQHEASGKTCDFL